MDNAVILCFIAYIIISLFFIYVLVYLYVANKREVKRLRGIYWEEVQESNNLIDKQKLLKEELSELRQNHFEACLNADRILRELNEYKRLYGTLNEFENDQHRKTKEANLDGHSIEPARKQGKRSGTGSQKKRG